MAVPSLSDAIHERLTAAGATVTARELAQLTRYLELLALWNRHINLTAFRLDDPSPAAIDRLVVEPVVASRFVLVTDQTLLDLGSGGGSPAIPLKIMRPGLRLTMVESRTRKAAFLREVIRSVGLEHAQVENDRFEQLVQRTGPRPLTDVLSFRAVRADEELWRLVETSLAPAGRVFWFGGADAGLPPSFVAAARHSLAGEGAGALLIAARKP